MEVKINSGEGLGPKQCLQTSYQEMLALNLQLYTKIVITMTFHLLMTLANGMVVLETGTTYQDMEQQTKKMVQVHVAKSLHKRTSFGLTDMAIFRQFWKKTGRTIADLILLVEHTDYSN